MWVGISIQEFQVQVLYFFLDVCVPAKFFDT